MAKYKVVGAHRVLGVEPSGTVDLEDDQPDVNVRALIRGGHLAEVVERKPVKATAKKSTDDSVKDDDRVDVRTD